MSRIPKELIISPTDALASFPGGARPINPLDAYRRASKSFENLVALANDQEVQTLAKKAVWRDRGEPPIPLDTFRQCLKHASKGALRAGLLAGAIRAGVNMFILLFTTLRAPKKFRMKAIFRAFFGLDSWRFAAMLGSFTFTYKLLLNALPLLHIPESPLFDFLRSPSFARRSRTRVHRHFTTQVEESSPPTPGGSTGYHTPLTSTILPQHRQDGEKPSGHLSMSSEIVYLRLDGARWHALVAGAAAGLSVLFERKDRRVTIAQQLFVRGLQGSWNVWSTKWGIKIPYGAVLVFTLSCGQIMYAFLLRPETIPRSYNAWILKASKVWPETMRINRQMVRTGTFDIKDMETLVTRPGNTPYNQSVLDDMLARARKGDFGGRIAGSCEQIHPWIDSCIPVEIDRAYKVFTWMFPIYGALHVIPMILFKHKRFLKEPLKMLWASLKGTVRSSTFLTVFVFIYQSILCMKIQAYDSEWAKRLLPPAARRALHARASFWVLGAACGLSLFVEEQRRRAELAMYVLPRGLESAWSMMRGKGWVPFIPGGDALLCAIGMGMVMTTYQHEPQQLSGLVRRVLYQFIGPN